LPIRLLKSYFVEQQLKYLDKISTDSPPAIYALGHTHTPFLQEFSGGIYLNPGMRSMIPVEKHLPFAEPLNVTENHNNGHGSFSFSTIDATNIQLRVIDDLRAYQRGDLNIPERSRVIGSLPIAGLKQSPSVV
jgi:hypothetical protein